MAEVQNPTSRPETPVATPSSASSSASSTTAAVPTTTVATTIIDLPDKLAVLMRQIQLNGPITDIQNNTTVTMQTAVGDLIMQLSAQAVENTTNNLLQQLTQIIQTQRTAAVTIQPGQPPTQALLQFPAPSAALTGTATPNATNAQQVTPLQTLPPQAAPSAVIDVGTVLTAVVLPNQADNGMQALSTKSYAPPTTPLAPASGQPLTPSTATPSAQTNLPYTNAGSAPYQQSAFVRTTPPIHTTAPVGETVTIADLGFVPAPPIAMASNAYTSYTSAGSIVPEIPTIITVATQPIATATNSTISDKNEKQDGVNTNAQTGTPKTANAPNQTTVGANARLAVSTESETALNSIAPQSKAPTEPATPNSVNFKTFSESSPSTDKTNLQPNTQMAAAGKPTSDPSVKTSPTTLASFLRPGVAVNLRVDAVVNNNAPTSTAPAASTTPIATKGEIQVTATVIGNGPQGQMLLNADGYTFFVRQGRPLPVGTKLQLTLQPLQADDSVLLQPPVDTDAEMLRQIVQTMAQIDPLLSQQFMQTQIAHPQQNLGATLMFLMNAFSKGNFKEWLGDAVIEKLEKAGKRSLMNSMLETLEQRTGTAHDQTIGEWRTVPLPLYDNGQMQFMQFYVRNDLQDHMAGQQRAQQPSGARTHFVINLHPTNLGAMQMDGLVQTKKLDIIIRSEHNLPPALPHELRELYLKTLSALGYTGTINFQIGRHHWLNIETKNAPHGRFM